MKFTDADKAERLRMTLKRRATVFYKQYSMQWTNRAWVEFVDRLFYAHHDEGIDDMDLRVLVRLFNREFLGRKQIG